MQSERFYVSVLIERHWLSGDHHVLNRYGSNTKRSTLSALSVNWVLLDLFCFTQLTDELPSASSEDTLEMPASSATADLIHSCKDGWHYVSCAVCCKQSDVVHMHGHKSRLPPTATEARTVYRKTVVADRIASPWHIEAKKCECLSKFSKVKIAQQAPLNQAVSTRAQKLLRWATVWTIWAQ